MIPSVKKNLSLFFLPFFVLSTSLAYAQHTTESAIPTDPANRQKSTGKTDLAELRAIAQNPLSPTYSLPLKYTYHGGNPRGGVSVFSIQPIFPIALGDWNLINQLSLNFIGTPGGVTGIAELPNPYVKYAARGPQGATGLADLNFSSLISPAQHGDVTWGIGASVTMPSDAPSRELGSGKFSVGPAAAWLMQTKVWTVGLQGSQLWSVIGSSGRKEVNQLQLKPILSYNLDDGLYLLSNMTVIANWEAGSAQQWTVPIGGGVGQLFFLGDFKINTRLEGYYNMARPDQAPNWSIGTTLQLLFPNH
jgi:hypothetical protein